MNVLAGAVHWFVDGLVWVSGLPLQPGDVTIKVLSPIATSRAGQP
jgi:hypothetical protein